MTNDPIDTLLIDVRASTQGFAADIQTMRGALDSTLIEGFAAAGTVLERGLQSALRRGSLGFDDLKRTAMSALGEIAAQAIGGLFPGTARSAANAVSGSLSGLVNGALGSVFGLPGRATGGTVAPGRGYLVGERGPELFIPASAGRIDASAAGRSPPRDVRVAIQLTQPRGSSAPQALQRSARQVASAVRRAMQPG